MNLSDQDFENELAAMKPVAPGNHFKKRIAVELEERGSSKRPTLVRLWPILPFAAACLILVVALRDTAPSGETEPEGAPVATTGKSPVDSFEPVGAEQVLVRAVDEGVVTAGEDGPVRRFRYEFIDTVTLVDESDGSVFTMQAPREEILYVPVTLL